MDAPAASRVVAACVVERLPIVLPTDPSWETEYQARDGDACCCCSASPGADADGPPAGVELQEAPAILQDPARGECCQPARSRSAVADSLAVQELTEPKTEAESTTKSTWAPAPVFSDSDGDLRCVPRAHWPSPHGRRDSRRR